MNYCHLDGILRKRYIELDIFVLLVNTLLGYNTLISHPPAPTPINLFFY